ncbi:putative SpoU rRNA Methylase family [Leishmania utingensis]|uniref:rRNA methyltransferase 1, mitochondrial n=1 Tax=Leishmania utingensis TaxID=653362 RepID=A0AAW3AWY0_9TRYP
MTMRTSAAVLRCTRPLLVYNRSGGYRWSPIPKSPPPHYDRLYGVHSVLNTLRVAAQRRQQQNINPHREAADTLGSTSAAEATPSAALHDVHQSSTVAVPAPPLHPHRAHLACLYVRDFSMEEGGGRAVKLGDDNADDDAGDDGVSSTNPSSLPDKPSHRLERERRACRKKVIPPRYTAVRCITTLAKSLKVPVRFVPRAELVQLCGERRNQNIVLEASSYKPQPIRHLGEIWGAEGGASTTTGVASTTTAVESSAPGVRSLEGSAGLVTVLFLERIIDPTNVGGILRTAFFFGVDHVVLSRQCATCTAAVSRTSTGFLEHLCVYRASTSSAAFLRASQEVWALRGSSSASVTAVSGLEIIASAVVSYPTAQRRGASEGAPVLPSAASSDSASSEVSVENGNDNTRACAQQPHPCLPAVRVLLLGNEDAGLPPDLLQWCTHVAHVRSPRHARLRHTRTSTQGGWHREGPEAWDADVEVEVTDTQLSTTSCDSAAVASAASAEGFDKHQHNLRRLARLRGKEVSLNVNTATAALLSALCGVERPLGNGGSQVGLVDVQPLCSPWTPLPPLCPSPLTSHQSNSRVAPL